MGIAGLDLEKSISDILTLSRKDCGYPCRGGIEMTESDIAPIYTRFFWAKAFPYRQRGPERIHLLEHHLADVGACFEALLAQPTIRWQ